MNIRQYLLTISAWISFGAGIAGAQYREWTPANRAPVRAEYAGEAAGIIVLRREDGTELKLQYSDLSGADRQFVQLRNPPRIDIRITFLDDTRTVGTFGSLKSTYQLVCEILRPAFSVRKNVTDDYTPPLTLEVVVIGQSLETDRFLVLDRITRTFRFTEENDGEFTGVSNPIDLLHTEGSVRAGIEYHDYVAAVRDPTGKIIALESGDSDLERHAATLLAAEPGAVFDRDLRPITPRRPAGTVLDFILGRGL